MLPVKIKKTRTTQLKPQNSHPLIRHLIHIENKDDYIHKSKVISLNINSKLVYCINVIIDSQFDIVEVNILINICRVLIYGSLFQKSSDFL